MKYNKHYDISYFEWQSSIGEFGGWANIDKFKHFIKEKYNIIDFGSGGGYLLKNIKCKDKIGIEINKEARKTAEEMGVKVVEKINEIEDSWADLIISNNVLEHTLNPLLELKELYKKLKKGGKIIFVVPCESIDYDYKPNNVNHHLYSWSPMSIGNLFNEAGFKLIESKPYKHKWPPYYRMIAKLFGRALFNIACRIYARLERSWYQVRIIGEK